MISLSRSDLPPEVEARLSPRALQLQQCLANGEVPPPAVLAAYKNPLLKQHLVAEANGKCAYCESKITHVYFGDVEHIKPKGVFPGERLSIENLCLACAPCNNAKGEFWDEATPLLNPYVDHPEDELLAFGTYLIRRHGSERARLSIERLALNRQPLLERRRERFQLLQPLADQYAQTPPGAVRDLIKGELMRQAADDAEYALMVRAFLQAACSITVPPKLGAPANDVDSWMSGHALAHDRPRLLSAMRRVLAP